MFDLCGPNTTNWNSWQFTACTAQINRERVIHINKLDPKASGT